jgi:hypothetical protein
MTCPAMNWLFNTLRNNPEIAIFLALALGFYVGGLKFGKFSLGNVTGVLIAGAVVGQCPRFLQLTGQRPARRRVARTMNQPRSKLEPGLHLPSQS